MVAILSRGKMSESLWSSPLQLLHPPSISGGDWTNTAKLCRISSILSSTLTQLDDMIRNAMSHAWYSQAVTNNKKCITGNGKEVA